MKYILILLLLASCNDRSDPAQQKACAEKDKLQHQYFMECLQNRRNPVSTQKDNEDDVVDSCHHAAALDVWDYPGCLSSN